MIEVFRTGDLTRKCSLGHEWPMKRKNQLGRCPFCSNRKVLAGFNDLLSKCPSLALEYSSSNPLSASEVVYSSTLEVLWECSLGHKWPALLSDRSRGRKSCIICSRRTVIPGVNDLFTTHPELEIEWAIQNTIDPTTTHFGSSERVWWVCLKCNNTYDSNIYNRTKGRECPSFDCQVGKTNLAKRATYVIKNSSLTNTRPDLMKEWDFVKNEGIDPTRLTAGVKDIVWWSCNRCSHSWESTVDNRNRGRGCPKCSNRFSYLEEIAVDAILEILEKMNLDFSIIRNSRPLRDDGAIRELDLYIPDLKLAFEIQDLNTHSRDSDNELSKFKGNPLTKKGPTYHQRKIELAKSQLDVDLYELWEDSIRDGSFVSEVSAIISTKSTELGLP